MPLINCPECDKEVADKARDCPSCGHRLNKPKRSVFGKICLWLFILFNIGMPVWIISTCAAVGETVNTGTDAEAAGATTQLRREALSVVRPACDVEIRSLM